MNKMRDRLIELILECSTYTPEYSEQARLHAEYLAQHLLNAGIVVPKKIVGYDDYSIDEYGNVYSYKSRRYISQQKHKDGYFYVGLCKDGKRKVFAVHRLVALHFIENKNGFPQVNHKDENKQNNEACNLEWCTEKYNTNYGTARTRQAGKISKAVVCVETGEIFMSQKDAATIKKVSYQHIGDCCNGKHQTCGGYHWRNASREETEKALAERKENG